MFGLFNSGNAIKGAVEGVGSVLDNLFTSDEERLEMARLMSIQQDKPYQDQRDINKVEASHRSVFVAGWRPYLGWVLSTSIGLYFIPQYLLGAILWTMQCWHSGSLEPFPLEIGEAKELILGLLGLAGIRTYEKKKGISK